MFASHPETGPIRESSDDNTAFGLHDRTKGVMPKATICQSESDGGIEDYSSISDPVLTLIRQV